MMNRRINCVAILSVVLMGGQLHGQSVDRSVDLAQVVEQSSDGDQRLSSTALGARAFGDTYDITIFWKCGSACSDHPDTGAGPGPCLGMTYDGAAETCGSNPFTGSNIEVLESEIDNGDGTVTVIVQVGASDGGVLIPSGTECAPGDLINTSGVHLGCAEGCIAGLRSVCNVGDSLDPGLGVSPFDILDADAVALGANDVELLSFPMTSAGTTRSVRS